MLILTRKKEEEIYIETPSGRIIIKIVDVDGKNVKLGVDAPKIYSIYRKELIDKVSLENKAAAFKRDIGSIPKIFGCSVRTNDADNKDHND